MAETLLAGFARVDITPECGGVPLSGYADEKRRLAARVLDPICVNAVALRNGEETCVMLTMDICELYDEFFLQWRKAVQEATGLPEDRIFIGTTHTHSSVAIDVPVPQIEHFNQEEMPRKLPQAARLALADLKPATLSYGATEVGNDGFRMNFNRYYYMTEIEKKDSYTKEDLYPVGDNYGWKYSRRRDLYCYVGHEEEADHSLQVLRFTREDADDIVLLNFAAHATITGGQAKYDLSADYPAALRDSLEQLCPGIRCSFLQGCAGNVNPCSRMIEESVRGLTFSTKNCNHRAYGAVLAAYAKDVLENGMRESCTETLSFSTETQTAKLDHSMDGMTDAAREPIERYKKEGYTQAVRELCLEKGFNSIYHCFAAVRKAKKPETGSFTLHALRVGDCAIVFAPFELFSATGLHIKEQSPYAMTLVKAYSCGFRNYLPSLDSAKNSYESNVAVYERGTAEELEKTVHQMLIAMH